MKNNLTLKELFLAAADVIQQRGLYKGFLYKKSHPANSAPVCILGALNVAFTGHPYPANAGTYEYVEGDALERAGAAVQKRLGERVISVWNDDKSRTDNDVIQLLHDLARGIK